jgi:surface antigen
MNKLAISSLLLGVLLISGCEGHKKEAGTILGGVTGGLLGSQFGKGGGQVATTALGAVAGAFIGNAIGSQMDEQDKAMNQRTFYNSMETAPTGSSASWKNPDNGHYGSVTPTRTYNTGQQFCREYTNKIVIGGKEQEGYGTACRQPDGSWKVVSSD